MINRNMNHSSLFRTIGLFWLILTGALVQLHAQEQQNDLDSQVNTILSEIVLLDRSGQREYIPARFDAIKTLLEESNGNQTEIHRKVLFEEAKLFTKYGQYARAIGAYEDAIEVQRAIHANEPPSLVDLLNRLSSIHEELGHYQEAITLVREILETRKRELILGDERIIASTTTLARLHRKIGEYGQAETILEEYRRGVVQHREELDISFLPLLYELADLYREIDDFERAEPVYIDALSLVKTSADEKSPTYIPLLIGIAELYLQMGQQEKAQTYLRKVKRKTPDGEIIKPGPTLMSLARLDRANGHFEDAEELYLDGMEYLQSDLRIQTPGFAELQYALASLYHEQGDTAKAKREYESANEVWKNLEGQRVPGYPQTLMGLGVLLMEQGKYKAAIDHFKESKQQWEQTLGKHYPLYLINILDLARAYWKDEQYLLADSLYAEVAELGRIRLTSAAHYMSARELNKYMQKIFDAQAEIISFALDSPEHSLSAQACYDNALFYKGFLLNNAIQIRRKASVDSLGTIQYRQMNYFRRLLASEFEKADTNHILQDRYTFLIDSFERELICVLTLSDSSDLFLQKSWDQVAHSLQPGEAVIEFVRYRSYQDETKDSILYVALVLVPGVTQPHIVPLFNEEVLSYILKPVEERTWKYVKSIYTSDMRGMVRSGPSRATLYELIWKRIESLHLAGVRKIYIAPAGVLHRINLSAIAMTPDSLISDRYTIVNLNSTRQLIPVSQKEEIRDSTVVIFGGISYDSIPDDVYRVVDIQQFSQDISVTQEAFVQKGNRSGTQVQWNYLAGTEEEAFTLAEICDTVQLNYVKYAGTGATESQFKSIGELGDPPSPWLLHIGTHGFFLSDPGPQQTDHMLNTIPAFKEEDQPMMRSGLIMAGANYLQRHAVFTSSNLNNGVLYAEEISHLDFSNTRLAVLSACDTGLGKIQGDEGVFGLQRAFKIAGAHYLIMSLWQLSDDKTTVFMDTFYRKWLAEGESIADAFRHTQHEMRNRFIDHYDWAGFILLE